MKKEQLSNSTPKVKYALAEKYQEETDKQHQKEVDGYERLKKKESECQKKQKVVCILDKTL